MSGRTPPDSPQPRPGAAPAADSARDNARDNASEAGGATAVSTPGTAADTARDAHWGGERGRPDRWLVTVESVLATVLAAGILLIILVQVVARVVFDTPLTWPEELAILCMMWLTFIGAGHAMAKGQHLCVDVLTQRLPMRFRIAVEVTSDLVVAATSVVIVWFGAGFVAEIGDGGSAALDIPLMWFYGATLAGLALVSLHSVINTVTAIRRGQSVYPAGAHPDAEDITEERAA